MATMQELRTQAKAAGVPISDIRSAESAEELQGLIVGVSGNGKAKGGRAMVRKAVKKTVTKKATVAKRGRPAKAEPVKRRGRPPGSKNKSTKISTPVKRGRPKGTTTKAKATTPRKSTNGRRPYNAVTTEGRHILTGVNYSRTDGWNPREGSAPDVILNALRRFKGDREKVFNHLKASVWDFVGRKMQDGSKRTLPSAHDMLRYRIARTDWDFALKTGQHEKSAKRVEYGTGGTGAGTFKRSKRKTAVKKAPVTTPKRRGRPPKAKTATTTPKRRGRPPGSKNKTTRARGIQVVKRGRGRPRKNS